MNVASLELCKELYELSGWESTCVYMRMHGTEGAFDTVVDFSTKLDPEMHDTFPAYDLGYLMRKLPQESQIVKGHFQFGDGIRYHAHYTWNTELPNRKRHYATESADTPEDAACKLAIELFKQGVLTKEHNHGE